MDDQLGAVRRRELRSPFSQQASAFIQRAAMSAGVGGGESKSRREVGVQQAERADGRWVPEDAAQPTISDILHRPKSVAMLQQRAPRADTVAPRIERIRGACFKCEGVAAPTIVIAPNPEHLDVVIPKVGNRGHHAKTRTRDNVLPRKPEIKEVAHDDERPAGTGERAKERQECAFGVV